MGWLDWLKGGERPAVWPRPLFTAGSGRAVFSFTVIGGPSAAGGQERLPAGVSRRLLRRDADPVAFVAAVEALRPGLSAEGGGVEALLQTVDHIEEIEGSLPDPPDYAALQAAWAQVRASVQAGAIGVFDGVAGRWYPAHPVLSPDPDPSRLARGFRVNGAPLEGHPGGLLCWTVGLAKAARPDLVMMIAEAQLPLAQEALLELGEQMSRGRRLSPGARVGLGITHVRIDPLLPGENAPHIALDNPNGGLLVVLFAGPVP